MERNLLNNINDEDMKLLSETISQAAASAALHAVRSVLKEGPPKSRQTKKTGVLKFSLRELNTMPAKLKNYFAIKDKIVRYRFHKGVYEVNYRRDGIKLYVAAKDLATLKVRFRQELEQYLLLHPECPKTRKSRYDLPEETSVPAQPVVLPQHAAPEDVLFQEYVDQWLMFKKQTVKPRTYQEYERMAKFHFEKDFRGAKLKDMTRARIQEYLFKLVEAGKHRTAEKLRLAFSCIFDLVSEDLGIPSPMKKIVLPYHESKKGSALTKDEEKKLVDFCIAHRDNAASSALLVMLYFGLRRSELKTIRIEGEFLICTTSKQRQGRVEVDRKIPFSPVFRRVLAHVDFDRAGMVNLSTIQTTFKRLFPDHHPHELRYTYITRANVRVQKGNQKTISRQSSRIPMQKSPTRAFALVGDFCIFRTCFSRRRNTCVPILQPAGDLFPGGEIVDRAVAERVECTAYVAVLQRLRERLVRPAVGRRAVETGQNTRIEGVARARRVHWLDVDGLERPALAAVLPSAAALAKRDAHELFFQAVHIVPAEGLHFVLGELDDVGKGDDLTVNFHRLPRVAEDIGAEVDVETHELAIFMGELHERRRIRPSLFFTQHERTDVNDIRPLQKFLLDGRKMIVRRVLAIETEGAVAVLIETDERERRISLGVAGDVFGKAALFCKFQKEVADEVLPHAADEDTLRAELLCGARHVEGCTARLTFVCGLPAADASDHVRQYFTYTKYHR